MDRDDEEASTIKPVPGRRMRAYVGRELVLDLPLSQPNEVHELALAMLDIRSQGKEFTRLELCDE
jgi:hypothetical protein